MKPGALRIARGGACLVVVDLQERLLPAMFERERVVQQAVRLIRGAAVLKLPVVVTEQYRKGLGATAAEVAAAVPSFAPLEKNVFSACGAPGFTGALESRAVQDVLLCGIETHVCVMQTCLDLLEGGRRVFVVTDAVTSRTPENYRLGLDRMREAGAVLSSVEMALFEMLDRAGTEEFKQILTLIK